MGFNVAPLCGFQIKSKLGKCCFVSGGKQKDVEENPWSRARRSDNSTLLTLSLRAGCKTCWLSLLHHPSSPQSDTFNQRFVMFLGLYVFQTPTATSNNLFLIFVGSRILLWITFSLSVCTCSWLAFACIVKQLLSHFLLYVL